MNLHNDFSYSVNLHNELSQSISQLVVRVSHVRLKADLLN